MRHLYQSTMFLIAALMVFSTVALLTLVALSSHGIERISREEDHEMRVAMALIEDAYRLKVALERQMVGLRGYLVAGEEELLRPWEEGKREFAAVAAELDTLLHDREDAQLLHDIQAIEAHHRVLAERLIALKRQGDEAGADRLFLAESSPYKNQLIEAVDQLIQAQRLQVSRIHEEVNRAEDEVRLQLMLAALVSVPITLLLAASLAWRVLVPLRELASASRALTDGHLEVRVPRHHHDEFGEVAAAFNTMAGAVERSLTSLRESNEELRRVDRYRDDFLSMVTHELKTPLTAIVGFARMLERSRSGPPLTETQRHSLAKILSNASRMLAMVNDLLDSTAIRQGRLELALAPTPYPPLLTDVVAQVQALAQHKGLSLVLGPQAEVSLPLDGARVAQVLTNMLSNAIKFTPEGGTVTIRSAIEVGEVLTEIEDTGPGIAPEDIPRLFQPFSRLAQETSGTGLGLSISRAIVEGHGGRIGVRSEPGQGSVFWFSLPLGA